MRTIKKSYRWQSGLSLIELMIAMVVGLVLMAGVLSIFISSRNGYGANTAAAQVQEYGRFALDFMRGNVRMTSYMGCATTSRSNTILNPVGQLYNFLQPVYGYEYNGTDPATATSAAPYAIASETPAGTTLTSGTWTPVGDVTTDTAYGTGPGVDITKAVPGSDALVLLSASSDPVYLTTPSAGSTLTVTTSTSLAPGQLAVISDCIKSTAFQISNSDNNTPGILTIGTLAPGPGNYQNTFSVGYDAGAQVLPASVMVYYVGQDTTGDNSPALFQAQLQTTGATAGSFAQPQVIVPGVENMQVLYGVNTTGGSSTTAPNQYLTAAQVDATNNWPNVLSVQLGLLVRSSIGAVPLPAVAQTFNILNTYVTAPRDTRLRHVFTSTIYLRNAPLPTS